MNLQIPKKAAVINSFAGYGRCSLTEALPILSAMRVQACPVPTAVFSNHTGFAAFACQDLTAFLPSYLEQWKQLNLTFDGVLCGFLGQAEQILSVSSFLSDQKSRGCQTILVDPVMGDGGKLYAHFDFHFVEKMRVLCEEADFILPNVTEACLLAGENYPLSIERLPAEKIVGILRSPHTCPIVTGVEEGEENAVYYGEANGVSRYALPHAKGFFHGAGDVFAAAFTGCLARGKSKKKAIELAANFTTAAIFRTAKAGGDSRYGLLFEEEIFNFLKELAEDEKE